MDHQTAFDHLSAYSDGELAGETRSGLETHLSGCTACREELGRLRSISAQFEALQRVTAPAGFAARILEELTTDEPSAWWEFWVLPRWSALAPAAAFAAVLLAWPEPDAWKERWQVWPLSQSSGSQVEEWVLDRNDMSREQFLEIVLEEVAREQGGRHE